MYFVPMSLSWLFWTNQQPILVKVREAVRMHDNDFISQIKCPMHKYFKTNVMLGIQSEQCITSSTDSLYLLISVTLLHS